MKKSKSFAQAPLKHKFQKNVLLLLLWCPELLQIHTANTSPKMQQGFVLVAVMSLTIWHVYKVRQIFIFWLQ